MGTLQATSAQYWITVNTWRVFLVCALQHWRRHACRLLMFLVVALLTANQFGFVAGAWAQATPSGVVATDARIAGDAERTRFVVDLNKIVDFVLFPLADPYRLVIDLPAVQFQLGEDLREQGRGLITGYRWGIVSESKSRMVLDLVDPVKVESTFMIPALDEQPARLVIDLVRTDRETFLNEQVSELFGTSPESKPAAQQSDGTAAPAATLPVVVIDPGHGGIDSGAVGKKKSLEKDIVLQFSKGLAEELRAGGIVEPKLTRTEDKFLSLGERVKIARNHNAALFISIHADSVPQTDVSGATVYTLSKKASDRVAAAVARQENRSDIIDGLNGEVASSQVEGILLNLMSRETKYLSQAFARTLVNTLSRTVPMIKNPNRSAAFKVLEAPDTPSILLELGYMSNPEDEERLSDAQWQRNVTAAIALAIEEYIRTR